MVAYCIYNTKTGNIRRQLGGAIPKKLEWPAGNNIIVYNATRGYTRGNLVITELVDDKSGLLNPLYEFVEWNPITYDANTFTVTRTGNYEQRDDGNVRRRFEKLVSEEMYVRLNRKLVVNIADTSANSAANNTIAIKLRDSVEQQTLRVLGVDAHMRLAWGNTKTYHLRGANSENYSLTQDEMARVYDAYVDRRQLLQVKHYELVDSNTIVYDYDKAKHWK